MATKQELQEATTLPAHCGCGGDIIEGVGCQQYSRSEDLNLAVNSETMMRVGGLGFGQSVFDSADTAVMSLHLQQNGLSHQQAEAILLGVRLV